MTGLTAKEVIDGRVTLEAKRLLAHTDLPVAAIAARLGFSEPTNLGKFLTRQAGASPGAFRATQRGARAEPPEAVAGQLRAGCGFVILG